MLAAALIPGRTYRMPAGHFVEFAGFDRTGAAVFHKAGWPDPLLCSRIDPEQVDREATVGELASGIHRFTPTHHYHIGAGVAWVKRTAGESGACWSTLPADVFDRLPGGEDGFAFADIVAMRIYPDTPAAMEALWAALGLPRQQTVPGGERCDMLKSPPR